MRLISGTFNGTGAALRVGIGFIPDFVRVWNDEDNGGLAVAAVWSKNMRTTDQQEGVLSSSDAHFTELVAGAGIAIYRGTPEGFSAAQTAYIVRDTSPNKQGANVPTASRITTWTLGSATNKTGSWNAECSTTYVGEGSRIAIRQSVDDQIKWATVVAMSSTGDQANEVTLSEAISAGRIEFLSGMYDYLGVGANTPMPAGFVINETGKLNTSGELCHFEAGQYDNDH